MQKPERYDTVVKLKAPAANGLLARHRLGPPPLPMLSLYTPHEPAELEILKISKEGGAKNWIATVNVAEFMRLLVVQPVKLFPIPASRIGLPLRL